MVWLLRLRQGVGFFTDADFGFVCLCFRGSGLTVVVLFFLIRQVVAFSSYVFVCS